MTSDPSPPAAATARGPAAASSAADERHDPAMRALYRMSRTAGVGLGDYAAVNLCAVVGLLLGVASALAFIFSDTALPLLIPLAAIVVSTLGFVQVSRSNGTQTGKLLAAGGLVLALGFAGLTLGKQLRLRSAESSATDEMRGLVTAFYGASASGNAASAYELFDEPFRTSVPPETFNRTLASRGKALIGGRPITGFALGPNVLFEPAVDGRLTQASSLLVVGVGAPTTAVSAEEAAAAPPRYEVPIVFARVGDGWKIHDIQNWFPAAPRGAGR